MTIEQRKALIDYNTRVIASLSDYLNGATHEIRYECTDTYDQMDTINATFDSIYRTLKLYRDMN